MTKQTRPSKHNQPAPIVNTAGFQPTMAEIARRAHEIFLARGGTGGSELDDWLQAERELKTRPAEITSVGARARIEHQRKS
jgi:hypothetical protein